MKRRHVLGDIYAHCDSVESIPVYMESKTEDPIGFVDESMGIYADTFLFHLPEDVCKKLSSGHYVYSFDYEVSDIKDTLTKKRRYKLNFILLTGRKAPTPVVRASKKNALAEIAAELELEPEPVAAQ